MIINAAWVGTARHYLVAPAGVENTEIARTFEKISGRSLHSDYVDLAPGIPDVVFISDIPKLQASWTRNYTLPQMIQALLQAYPKNHENSC